MQGWIRLHRSIMDNWLYEHKPFCEVAAWIDLLMLANHEAHKMPQKGKFIIIERGQLFTCSRTLSERWGWSRGKVDRFLTLLENDGMLIKNRATNGTTLTIVNYGFYQDTRATNEQQMSNARATNEQRVSINNNDKNDKSFSLTYGYVRAREEEPNEEEDFDELRKRGLL